MARRKTTVRLHHPKTGGHYEAPPTAVPFWESKGWKRVDDAPKTTTATAKAAEKKEA